MAAQAVKANVTCGRADVTSMAKKAPREGVLEAWLAVGGPDTRSAGLPAVVQTLAIGQEQTGPVRAPVGWDEALGVIEEHFRCTRLMPWAGPAVPRSWFQAQRITR